MKHYLFDFDGTLVDSMPTWSGKMKTALMEEGIEPPEDLIKIITPLGDKGAAEYLVTLGVNKTVDEIIAFTDDIARDAYENSIPLKKGVLEFLQKSKEQGIYMAVLTASPHKFLDPCLKRTNTYELFDAVWSIEDFGALKKNQVEIYQAVASKIGCNLTDITFFDDNIIALKTAKQAGYKTVGVFDATSEDMIEEIKQETDKYIYSFSEM